MSLTAPDLERYWPVDCAECGVSASPISPVAKLRHWSRYQTAVSLYNDQSLQGYRRPIIDWGCGTGYGTALMASTLGPHRVGARVIGYDPSAAAITHARHAHGKIPSGGAVEFTTEAPDSRGAVVFMVECIEHMPRAAARAVIAPAFMVFVTTPFCPTAANPHHEHVFTDEREVRAFMADCGHHPVEEQFWHGVTFTDDALGVQYLGLFRK